MDKRIENVFNKARKCSLCTTIPSANEYKKYGVLFPVPFPKSSFAPGKIKILFVLESPGTAQGGSAQTGVYSDETNFDRSAMNSKMLREIAKIPEGDCFFTNSVLHTLIDENGGMRKPIAQEIRNCTVFLKDIIDIIDPPIVVPMGGIALNALNRIEKHSFKKITTCAGERFNWYNRVAFPLVHCSPLGLANRSWDLQIQDYLKLKKLLDGIKRG